MSDKDIVPISTAPAGENAGPQRLSIHLDGAPAFVDMNTGHVFDGKGNDVGRWSIMDSKKTDDSNQALANYAARYASHVTACSLYNSGRSENNDVIVENARQFQRLAFATEKQRTQMLDLGVTDVHQTSPLPNFITGYKNFSPVADIISPPILVEKQSDKYYQYSPNDAFQRALPILGSMGAGVSEVTPQFANTNFSTIMRAIAGFVPSEILANQDAVLRVQQATARRMVNVQLIEREFRVQSVLRTSGNWASATTIAATYNWNGGVNSDPVKDIHAAIDASYGDVTGMLVPGHIWRAMTRNPAVRAYYAYGGTAPGILTDQQMAAILKLPEIYIANMKYINTSGTLSYIWGNDVILFSKATKLPPVDQEEVATSYTFRWGLNGAPIGDKATLDGAAEAGRGFVMRQFYDQRRGPLGGIQMLLCVADAEKQTSAYIGNLLINAYQ